MANLLRDGIEGEGRDLTLALSRVAAGRRTAISLLGLNKHSAESAVALGLTVL